MASEKPTTYFVAYVDDALWEKELARVGGISECVDPTSVELERDAKTLLAARAMAGSIVRSGRGNSVRIYKRVNVWDETPAEVTWDTWWRWDEELIEDDEQEWLR